MCWFAGRTWTSNNKRIRNRLYDCVTFTRIVYTQFTNVVAGRMRPAGRGLDTHYLECLLEANSYKIVVNRSAVVLRRKSYLQTTVI